MLTIEEMEERAFALLCQRYVQRADKRQKEMGLSYTEAETRDLAKTMVRFASAVMAQNAADAAREPENPFHPESPEGRAWEAEQND